MRYQLQSEHGQFSWKPRYFTDAIKILIGVNILLFVFRTIAQEQIDLAGALGLHFPHQIPKDEDDEVGGR